MRIKIVVLSILAFCFLSLKAQFMCGGFRSLKGILMVVDNQGNQLKNAKLWVVYSNLDSTLRRKSKIEKVINGKKFVDSIGYNFYTNIVTVLGAKSSYYRIHCDGFADVILDDIRFSISKSYDTSYLIIKMCKPQFYFKGDFYFKLNNYYFDDIIVEVDTLILAEKEFIASFMNEPIEKMQSRIQSMKFSTYPNPVLNTLKIEISETIIQPYTIEIIDVTGKQLLKQELTESLSAIDLEYLSSAFYYVKVCDNNGEMQFCRRIVKIQ